MRTFGLPGIVACMRLADIHLYHARMVRMMMGAIRCIPAQYCWGNRSMRVDHHAAAPFTPMRIEEWTAKSVHNGAGVLMVNTCQ